MKKVTRRQALKRGGITLALTGATATLGFPMMAKADDSELLAMNRKLEAAKLEEEAACNAYSEAEGAAFKEAGKRPENPDFFYNPEVLQWEPRTPRATQEERDDYERDDAQYEKGLKRAEAKHGVKAADNRNQKAAEHTDAIEAALLAIPAATVAGVLLKARIITGEGDPSEAAVRGLLADLERLAT